MRHAFAIARVEVIRLLRTRVALTLLLLVPAFQVILFGYAIRPQGSTVTIVIAAPTSQMAAAVSKRLGTETGLKIVSDTLKSGDAEAQVRAGKAMVGIEIPETRSFANPFAPLRPVRVVIDSSNPALTGGSAALITAYYWRALAEQANVTGNAPGLKIIRLYNPQSRADWTFLPALIGVTVMISMILLGCLSLAREREAGTWETLLSLPVGRGSMLFGKLLPYVILGTAQGVLVLGVGIWLFDLPTRGSVLGLLLMLPLFSAAHFLLGYAISARSRTQMDALQGAIAFYLPAMLLSGFLYPFESLPAWAQIIGNVFPLTHFIHAARNVLLRGANMAELAGDGLAIAAVLATAAAIGFASQAQRLD